MAGNAHECSLKSRIGEVSKERMLSLLWPYVDAQQATLIAVTHDHALLAGFSRVIEVHQLYSHALP
jgi:ABC-type lipoprotein export system ATPase subunit